jgi:hypothetical protein
MWDRSTLGDGTNRPSRNVGKKLSFYSGIHYLQWALCEEHNGNGRRHSVKSSKRVMQKQDWHTGARTHLYVSVTCNYGRSFIRPDCRVYSNNASDKVLSDSTCSTMLKFTCTF